MASILSEARDQFKNNNSGLTAVLVLATLYFARDVFVPLALAGLLAFLLAPAAARLERWGIRRGPAALLVVFLSIAGVGTLGWAVLQQVYSLAVELPQYQQNVEQKVTALHLGSAGKLSRTIEMMTNVAKQVSGDETKVRSTVPSGRHKRLGVPGVPATYPTEPTSAQAIPVKVEEPQESMVTMAERTIIPLIHPLTTTLIVVIFLIFIMLGREGLRDRGLRLAGSGRIHVTTTAIEDASRRVSRFLQMQLVVNLCYGGVVGVSLWWIGIPHPLLWAVLTCLLRFVPYVGILMAAAGPLLLSGAASPGWHELMWTAAMFGAMELVTANFAEPMLYGASTGMSAIAILIAAIFWTLLWGLPGLLLSTPLTVCLIVIGRQVPQLAYLEVLFGEEEELPPAERFYQRLVVSNTHDATVLVRDLLREQSQAMVYDDILVPALTQIEDARHAEEITSGRADELLQSVEEIAEETLHQPAVADKSSSGLRKRVACVPARDFGDEIACQLAAQILAGTAQSRVLLAESSTGDLLQSLERGAYDVICVVGVPPRALRHIRMRSHQIRACLPDAIVVACLLSKESDLSNLRSRVPVEDAQHVVCSLQLMQTYIASVLNPASPPLEVQPKLSQETEAGKSLTGTIRELHHADLFDGTDKDVFSRLAGDVARSFDAPIALITVADGKRRYWEAQCGLPEETLHNRALRDLSICSKIMPADGGLFLADICQDERFSKDSFLCEKGIRFYAGVPLRAHNGEEIGSLCVLDTRPRLVTEEQKNALTAIADSVMTAIELHGVAESVSNSEL